MNARIADNRIVRHGLIAAICYAILGPVTVIAQEGSPVMQTVEDRSLQLARGNAEVLYYDADLGTVIIGDAAVAVASVAQSNSFVLTGLSEGKTNAIVLDGEGKMIDKIVLHVFAPGQRIVVWRGMRRDVQSCDPSCALLEDAPPVSSEASSIEKPGAR